MFAMSDCMINGFDKANIRIFSRPINRESMSSVISYPSHSVSRGRLPSFEVQRDTRATLQAALETRKLPASLADIGGLIVSEKNTFINIETTDCCEDSDCDKDLRMEEPSPVFPKRDRKPTEGVLSPVRERGYSCMSSRARWSSCPPKLEEDNVSSSGEDSTSHSSKQNQEDSILRASTRCDNSCRSSPSRSIVASPAVVNAESEDIKTTVMLRNVPYSECQVGVLELVRSKGFAGRFDFFYAPLDFNSGNNLGYAFINLLNEKDVREFFKVFEGLRVEKEGWSQKDLQVCWARVQGMEPNVEHYRNSPVNDMPESFRPMIFGKDGEEIAFPRPDENVPRRPIPTTSMYSGGGNRAAGIGRPRFASAQFPSAPPRRPRSGVGSGSFSVQYRP